MTWPPPGSPIRSTPCGTSLRTWLEICVEPEIHRIALIDGPSVVGWAHWREVCQRHVFGLAEAMLEQGIESGRIRPQPVRAARPRAHGR